MPVFGTDEVMSGHPYLDTKHLEIGKDVLYRDVQSNNCRLTYAMVETVDSHIGKILEKLDEAGQNLDDWIIVFTSDHGEMLGEHGIWGEAQILRIQCSGSFVHSFSRTFCPSQSQRKCQPL